MLNCPTKAAIIAIQLYICPRRLRSRYPLPAYAITQFAGHIFSVNRPSLAIFLPNPLRIIEADFGIWANAG